MVAFHEPDHSYYGIGDDFRDVQWISSTGFVGRLKPTFDKIGVATKVSAKKGSKWAGMKPNDIVDIWDMESRRSTDIGSMYHAKKEAQYYAMKCVKLRGKTIDVYEPWYLDNGDKVALTREMNEGFYPERLLYHKLTDAVGVCGQSDVIARVGDIIDIADHKTNKELTMENKWQRMLPPMGHLDDCHYNHYAIQLSLYMWIALKSNPGCKPGRIVINHAIMEVESTDKWGYPKILMGADGYPVCREVVKYELPYLETEVLNGIDYLVESVKSSK